MTQLALQILRQRFHAVPLAGWLRSVALQAQGLAPLARAVPLPVIRGAGGGQVLAVGPPEAVAAEPRSYTGQALRTVLPQPARHFAHAARKS